MSKPLAQGELSDSEVSSVEDVIALVRARGGRATSSKRLLLETLFELRDHFAAEELALEVQQKAPDVHISTIYRNLEELQKLGVVVHSHIGHGPATYQLASYAHAHFVCGNCGAMIEAPDQIFDGLEKAAKSKLGFSIDPRHFAILGTCADCA